MKIQWIKFVILISAVLLAFGTQASAQDATFNQIKHEGKVRVGWAPYAPYASKNPKTGQVEGFYVEMFNAAMQEAGIRVEWVETTWSTMVADMKVGHKFDVMAAPVFRTVPRALEISFTRPIDYFGNSVVVRADDHRFKTTEDFNKQNLTLAVTQGEVGYEYAKRHLTKAKLSVHESGDISIALIDVIQKRADAGICDAWTAREFVKAHPGVVVDLFAGRPFNIVGAGWFVDQGAVEWLQFLNTSIDWLQTSGTMAEIAKKYQLPSIVNQNLTSR